MRGVFCFERDEKGGKRERSGAETTTHPLKWESAAGANPPRDGDSEEAAVTVQQQEQRFQHTEI